MNEMCKLCSERAENNYCYNIGVQTDEDIEITYCHEFKPVAE